MSDRSLRALPYGSTRPGAPPNGAPAMDDPPNYNLRQRTCHQEEYEMNTLPATVSPWTDPETGTERLPQRPRERKIDKIYHRWCCGSCLGIVLWVLILLLLLIIPVAVIAIRLLVS